MLGGNEEAEKIQDEPCVSTARRPVRAEQSICSKPKERRATGRDEQYHVNNELQLRERSQDVNELLGS